MTLAALLTETPPPSIQRLIQKSDHHPNLFYIPSDRARMIHAARELPTLMANETRLQRALQQVQIEFAYIIIDTPPNTGDLLINALVAADYVIIPVETSYLGVSGSDRTAAHHRTGAGPLPPRPADPRLPAHPVRRAARRGPGDPGGTAAAPQSQKLLTPIHKASDLAYAHSSHMDIFTYRPPRVRIERVDCFQFARHA